MILKDKEPMIKIDGKVRRDQKYPVGFMDVVSIDKTNEHYRVLYDIKGRFTLVKIKDKEAKYKICRVVRKEMGVNQIPYIVTNDARTIRFPHPDIQVHDSVKVDTQEGKISEFFKFEPGTPRNGPLIFSAALLGFGLFRRPRFHYCRKQQRKSGTDHAQD